MLPGAPRLTPTKTGTYLLLLAVQILGAITFIGQALPEFRQIAINPAEQLPRAASRT